MKVLIPLHGLEALIDHLHYSLGIAHIFQVAHWQSLDRNLVLHEAHWLSLECFVEFSDLLFLSKREVLFVR